MSAGRPRSFEEQEVIVRATDLFWRQGYEATGLTQLLQHINMARQSLYNVFGEKRGLYLKCLEYYSQMDLERLDQRLSASQSAYDSLYDCLLTFAAGPPAGEPAGCLIVHAACEFGRSDSEIGSIVQNHWNAMSARIGGSLENSIAGGDLPAGVNVQQTSRALTHTITAICVMQRAGVPADEMHQVANAAIEGIAVNTSF